jgi:hypothetical protein
MIYKLLNIRTELIENRNPIKMRRVYGSNSINNYELLEDVSFELSNGVILKIPKGYKWDLSSVPRLLWWLLPPDGDFQIGTLIHDFLYEYKIAERKFADQEMYKWSVACSATKKQSLRNIDNKIRLAGVRAFGWYVYNK